MDPEFWKLLEQQKGALILTAGAGLFVVLMAFVFRKLANHRAADPKVILRRCRMELRLVRNELRHYPATREIHEICAGLDTCEATIDQVVAKL